MTDILDEIEQDLRKDRAARFWKKWGGVVIVVAGVFVLAIAGWRGYVGWQQSRAAALGDRYVLAIQASEAGNHDEALAAFQALARDGTGGYPGLARFRIATEQAAKGEADAAVQSFDAIAADTSAPESWRHMARLRAAAILVDQGKFAEVAQRAEALAVAGNPLRHTAREVLGLAAFKADDKPAAARWMQALISDPEVPESARTRASLVLNVLAADGVTP
jgi:hypothetical protein